MAERIGQQLGNYHLLRELGAGGFAEVYLGEHIHLGTQAAIKVLHTQLNRDDVETFRTEARTIARLIHPHIVRVLEFGIEEKTPFLVMDYAPNGTVRQRHPKGRALPLSLIVAYVEQVADALQYAHNEKLIHRDVKPENILLGRRNELLLSDFGIALVAQSSRYQSTQEMVGTMAYMAPEQIQGKPRPASDQYALGIMVYEWLTGDRPFHGTLTELVGQHLAVAPASLLEKISTISPEVDRVVLTALAKDPRQRFDTIQTFADALRKATQPPPSRETLSPTIKASLGASPIPAEPVSPSPSDQKPFALVTPVIETNAALLEPVIQRGDGGTSYQMSVPALYVSPPKQQQTFAPPKRWRVLLILMILALIGAGASTVIKWTGSAGSAWTAQHSGTGEFLQGVVWAGSQWVAVGTGGTILTSPDGRVWTTRHSGTSQNLHGVAGSGSQWVAVGYNGTILTSHDGRVWTTQNSGTLQGIVGVVWSGSLFVAVGGNGTILTSPDGYAWTAQYSGTSQNLTSVAGSGSQWVAVGDNSTILTSPDGYVWMAQNSGTSQNLTSVAWSDSQWVAVGDNSTILTSPDGNTWTTQRSGTSQNLTSVAGSGSQWVAVGYTSGANGTILTSPDGHTWTASGASQDLHSVVWAGSQWVAVGAFGTILTSP